MTEPHTAVAFSDPRLRRDKIRVVGVFPLPGALCCCARGSSFPCHMAQARSCSPSVFRGRPCARWCSRSRSERSRARAAALAPPWRVVVLLAWWERTILVPYTRARLAARSPSEMNPGNSGRPHPSRRGEWQPLWALGGLAGALSCSWRGSHNHVCPPPRQGYDARQWREGEEGGGASHAASAAAAPLRSSMALRSLRHLVRAPSV